MRRTFVFLAISLFCVSGHAATELFFSEYIEGSSNNKALEIYNGTGAPVNLSSGGYNVQMFFNGSTTAGTTINLTGTVADGDVFVLAQASANATILAQADQTNGSSWYNGDDAVVLRKGTTIIDVIGQIGFDPGAEWGSGTTSTADNTLRRKTTVCAGDTNGSNAFDPSTEWDGFAPDTFGGLGTHTADCTNPSLSINDATVTEGDSGTTTATFTVSLSAPPGPGGISFNIQTQDGGATVSDGDYVAKSLPAQTIFAPATTYTFEVSVNGDTNIEPNETFTVQVSAVVGANVSDGEGLGTITNDDFPPPLFEVSVSQIYGGGGNSGATLKRDFIELFNRGTTTVDVTGWSVQYASASGSSWQVTTLSGSVAPGGYYLVQQAAGAGGTVDLPTPDATGSIAMNAMMGKVALRTNSTALAGTCPAGATIVDFVGYGSANCSEGSGPTAQISNSTAALRKRGGCFDSNNNSADFSIGSPNPRNSATATRSCEYVPAAIHEIQGDGPTSPYNGQDVTTTGVVTARKSIGFFVQTPDAGIDTNPDTSEGVFVFTSSAPAVAVGDFVSVKGTALEFFNLTQLDSTLAGDITVNSSGSTLPSPIVLTNAILNPAGSATQLEKYEGMRMHAASVVTVSPTNGFGEVFAVLAGVDRPMREPGIEASLPIPPDPSSGEIDCCIPIWDGNPERIMIDSDGLIGSTAVNVTSNVSLSNITGPLDFTFGDYKLLPESAPLAVGGMSAVPVPLPGPGDLTVAGFNIENFSNGTIQRQKASLAIRNVMRSPDIIGHVEIANLASLEALATQVNNDSVAAGQPNPAYEARLIPFGTGTQQVGFLVKTSRVRVDAVTQERAGETYINPNSGQPETLHDRPPLVLRATFVANGVNPRPVIVIVNHLRSFIDIELVSGEGARVRAKRTAQAESLAGLLQELQAENPTTPIVSVGDYNAFQFNDGYTDPISVIKGMPTPDEQIVVDQSPDLVTPDFFNLVDELSADQRYSFIFEGTPQALDHVIVNTVAHSYRQRFAIARNNSDFPETFSADSTRPEASSDHDMPVAYFGFPAAISDLSVDKPVLKVPNHKMQDVTVSYTVGDNCGGVVKSLSVSSNEPVDGTGDGDTAPDWEIIDAHHVRLRAERDGNGRGRVYTITVTVTNDCGLTSQQTIQVTVPHDQGK